jgi:hypothetical protein
MLVSTPDATDTAQHLLGPQKERGARTGAYKDEALIAFLRDLHDLEQQRASC